MKLVIDFGGLGTFRNEVLNLICLWFVSGLEAWRIMEDKFGVAGKDEWTIDIVDAALAKIWESRVQCTERTELITSAVGSICYGMISGGVEAIKRHLTHQVVIFLIVNAWLFIGVANTLQECRFSCIGTPDNEDAKVSVFLSSVKSVVEDSHLGCRRQGAMRWWLIRTRVDDTDSCCWWRRYLWLWVLGLMLLSSVLMSL